MPKKMLKPLRNLKNKGKIVKHAHCGNAGENVKLKELCGKNRMGVEFVFAAPNMPQQSGVVECKFAALFGRARAMLGKAGL